MACASGCETPGAHASYGECMRAKMPRVAYCNSANNQDYSRQKQWDRTLDAYRDARRQGIQPSGTSKEQVERAVAISNETGAAYKA